MSDVWWTISGVALREALRRAHAGDDPEVVYLELWANSEHHQVDGGEGAGPS